MKRPSFQFYPADWKNNSKLRRCSEAARGAWVDVLCLLHDCDEYGVCRWPLADVASAAGVPLKLVRELVAKDVLKGGDKEFSDYVYTPRHAGKAGQPVVLVAGGIGPCWYSSRLVRDEWVRQRRGQSTRFSEDNQPPMADSKEVPNTAPNSTPKPTIGVPQGYGPTSTSTSKNKGSPQKPPHPAEAGLPEESHSSAIALPTFLDRCKEQGMKPIPEGDAVFDYAAKVGIPQDFLRLQWLEFKERYSLPNAKRYRSWPIVFGKSVRGNWFKLWYAANGGSYALTTVGQQAQRNHGGAA